MLLSIRLRMVRTDMTIVLFLVEKSLGGKLSVCLYVRSVKKTFPTENIKISIFVMNDDLMVVLPLWGQRNIFHKREIIYNSEQLEVADDQLLAVTYNSH